MRGKTVFVGNLPRGCREKDISDFFRGYGRIVEVLMKGAYCFVDFDDARDASDAVRELDGKQMMGERLAVEHAKGTARGDGRSRFGPSRPRMHRERKQWMDKYGPPVRTDYRLIVQNLPSHVSWQDLKDHMRKAGDVTYADAHKENKNEGVIEFASYGDMKNAIDTLNDSELGGSRIRLIEDPSVGSKARSRSSSRSPRRSVSRDRGSRAADRDRSRSRSPIRERERSRSRSRDRYARSRSNSRGRSRLHDRNETMIES